MGTIKTVFQQPAKRGVNLSSPLYAEVKNVMREALKHFTSFTNDWKGQSFERDAIQNTAQPIDIRDASQSIPSESFREVRLGLKGKRFVPPLPKPKDENANARITFSKSKADIHLLAMNLFDSDARPKPGQVGEAAFDWALKEFQ